MKDVDNIADSPCLGGLRMALDKEIDKQFEEAIQRFNDGLLTRNEVLQIMVMLEDTGNLTRIR